MKDTQALMYVKKNPNIFLTYGTVDAHDLISRVVYDAISLGVVDVFIENIQGVWIVGSTERWICRDTKYSPEDIFYQIIPNPRAGQNCSRHEVVLTAFAKSVYMIDSQEVCSIKGDIEKNVLEEIVLKHPEKFMLAFEV